MPYFISYSHEDKDFVDLLAAELALERRHVWVDRWELKVGDSLIRRIESAITDASGLIVILSKASVVSEWFRKELSAGLIRELEEKRVVVLPIRIDDCDIPLFLREKKYADFRTDFEEGLNQILDATASITSDKTGRHEDMDFFHDWAADAQLLQEQVILNISGVSFYKNKAFSILTQTRITGEQTAARKYNSYDKAGLGAVGRAVILTSIVDYIDPAKLQLWISNDKDCHEFAVKDKNTPLRYDVRVCGRRLGDDVGSDFLYDYGVVLKAVRDTLMMRSRPLTQEELIRIVSGKMGG
jgi:TIR domain